MGRGKSKSTMELIEAACTIIEETKQISVRGVSYRLFAAGLIDSMAKANTNRVSTQLVYAREQGLIPWDSIVDETRQAKRQATWADKTEFCEVAKRSFRRDAWQLQDVQVEVWSEKATVSGILVPVLYEYGVTFQNFRGYGSATVVHSAALDSVKDDRQLVILYVGDGDPSGLHMSQVDLPTRLERYGGQVSLYRIALTSADLASLPSFPLESKTADPRWRWFRDISAPQYGPLCWELDALNPVILRKKVEDAIVNEIEPGAWARVKLCEEAEQASLVSFLDQWQGLKQVHP